MTRADFLKQAYLQGFEKAAEEAVAEGFEKEAAWGWLTKILPWLGKATGVASKATGVASKAAPAAAAATKPGLLKNIGSLTGMTGGPGSWGYSLSKPLSYLPGVGREGAHQALGFGTIGGTLGAMTADEGDRLSGFAKGFGLGTIGGLGWHWGQKGSQALMKGFANTGGKDVGGLRGAMRRVINKPSAGATGSAAEDLTGLGKIYSSGRGLGESAKLMGARGLYGVGGFGVGMLGSGMLEEKAEKYIPSLRSTAAHSMRQMVKAPFAVAQTVGRGRFGLTPGASPGASSGTYPGAY